MNMMVGATLSGTTFAPPAMAAVRPSAPLSMEEAPIELQAAAELLEATSAAYDASVKAFDEARERMKDWEKRNKEPASGRRRQMNKWFGRRERAYTDLGFYVALDANRTAEDDFQAAKRAAAIVPASNLRELALKACLAEVYELPKERLKRGRRAIVAESVTRDVTLLLTMSMRGKS